MLPVFLARNLVRRIDKNAVMPADEVPPGECAAEELLRPLGALLEGVEVHFSDGKAHIYLNRGGVLDSAPSWTFDSPHVGTAIAFGDLNGDDLPDLIVGNAGDTSIWVFYNTGEPPLFADDFESGDTTAWSDTVP